MKFKRDDRYTTIAVYAALVILFSVVCIFFFVNYNDFGGYISKLISVFSPIIIGAVFAYLLNPMMKLFENKVFSFLKKKNNKRHLQRALSLICTMLITAAFVAAFFVILIPQISAGYSDLSDNMKLYIDTVQKFLNKIAAESEILGEVVQQLINYINEFLSETGKLMELILPGISNFLKGFVNGLKNSLLGLVFAIYFLASKERLGAQFKKIFRAIFKDKAYNGLMHIGGLVDTSFGAFISTKLFDSLIIGILCFIGTWILGIPYYPLISLIIGISNIIPMFGPFIGAIPCVFFVFISNPIKTIVFIIFIIVLQLFDGNILWPRLYGNNSGLPATWAFVSIIVMTGFFGISGMIFGVPIFAAIYSVIRDLLPAGLRKRGAPESTEEYLSTETGERLYNEAKARKENRKSFTETALYKKISETKLYKNISSRLKKRKSSAPDTGEGGSNENPEVNDVNNPGTKDTDTDINSDKNKNE